MFNLVPHGNSMIILVTPNHAQGLSLAQGSLQEVLRDHVVPGIKPGPTTCKESNLTLVV